MIIHLTLLHFPLLGHIHFPVILLFWVESVPILGGNVLGVQNGEGFPAIAVKVCVILGISACQVLGFSAHGMGIPE